MIVQRTLRDDSNPQHMGQMSMTDTEKRKRSANDTRGPTDNLTRAEQVATEQADEMGRKLAQSTPAELGWPSLTAEEFIALEYLSGLND